MTLLSKPFKWICATLFFIVQTGCNSQTVSETERKILSEACQAIKANDKKIACMNAVGKLSPTAISEPTSRSSSESITLRGVPFDVPDSRDALMNLCLSPDGNYYTAESLRKDETWCKFRKGRISMPSFAFGNLSTVAWATVDEAGALTHFEINGSKNQLLELASLLAEKYGKPQIVDTQVENNFGTKFDKKIFTWLDKNGTRIVIDSIYEKIDQGKVRIDSASYVKLMDALGKIQKEAEKSKL